jgi:RND family efflux transporter MFP subunit
MTLRNTSVLISAVIGLGLTAASCGKPEVERTAAAATNETPSVSTVQAARRDLSRELVLTGELTPYQEVEVMAKMAGYVQKIFVDVGDTVRQGQVLAILEIPELKDDVSRASAASERNRVDLKRVQDEVRRAETAYQMTHLTYTRLSSVAKKQPGLVAQQEIDDAMAKDQIAEVQIAAAKSALAVAQEQVKVTEADRTKSETLLQYTRVTAPFDGVVTKRYANSGAMVQAGVSSQTQAMPVVRISQHGVLRLILRVPESNAGAIKTGSAVRVVVPSLQKSFAGKVARTADQVDAAARTMHTEVDVPNPNRALMPGMYAEVTLRVAESKGAVTVPLTCVEKAESGNSLLVVNSANELERRKVETGIESSSLIEIKDGLHEGEIVVIGARAQLKPGQKVRSKPTEEAGKKGGAA